ncbi:ABC transporter substrate-binding protein [Anaerococcus urinomassiliensis]|uniref:ABC transporter substrate-binding protein n=1 Tax=Anaerococcus urinomassiliensis TaxID=1745712 RepID=UPI00093D333A|nr:ABC transporter substrate-binding protein [Anaerococcus urinomassiliensis]
MKIKKIFSSVMALGLSLTLASCGGSDSDSINTSEQNPTSKESTDETADRQEENDLDQDAKKDLDNFESQTSNDTLVVGVGSMNGDFIQGFGNDANDVKTRRLLGIEGNNGFTTYVQDENGKWQWNKSILAEEPTSVNNDDGSMTVTFKLKDDVKWSDGELLTADDFLFLTLLQSDYNYISMTGSLQIGDDGLVGYEAFHNNDSNELEGLEKIDDHSFSVTIDAKELPYFDVQSLSNEGARPLHYIAPNLQVAENGKRLQVKDGYEVTEQDKEEFIQSVDTRIGKLKEEFDENYPEVPKDGSEEKEEYDQDLKDRDEKIAELEASKEGDIDPTRLLIDKAAIFETEEYRFKPEVTPGPYKFESFKNNMTKLSLNENYPGNFKGDKATIPNIILQVVNDNIAVDLLENGDIDVWEDENKGGKIDQMRKAADEGKIQIGSFERNGYGNITFLTDRGSTQYKEVRQAIAYLMDRNEFVASYAGGYGVVTNGMYGQSQWMYKERGADVESEMINYTLNIDKANELLDQTPYKYEKDGKTPWDKAKLEENFKGDLEGFDYYRYDENGKRLVVNQYGSDQSPITTLISNQLPINAAQAGMEYNVTSGSFSTLIELYNYPKENPDYTAFNMGSDFGVPFDPWLYYSQEGPFNKTRTNDPEADKITEDLRRTDPSDVEGFLDKWVKFQIWYNDYLPEIPLYSNIFHTGYSNRVKGFDVMSPVWHLNDQINAITLGE